VNPFSHDYLLFPIRIRNRWIIAAVCKPVDCLVGKDGGAKMVIMYSTKDFNASKFEPCIVRAMYIYLEAFWNHCVKPTLQSAEPLLPVTIKPLEKLIVRQPEVNDESHNNDAGIRMFGYAVLLLGHEFTEDGKKNKKRIEDIFLDSKGDFKVNNVFFSYIFFLLHLFLVNLPSLSLVPVSRAALLPALHTQAADEGRRVPNAVLETQPTSVDQRHHHGAWC
jgi:hypothetical protein